MNAILTGVQLSPMVSEFDTQEQAISHDTWFRAKVNAAINSTKPKLAHDAAVAKLNAGLIARRAQRANSRLV